MLLMALDQQWWYQQFINSTADTFAATAEPALDDCETVTIA